FAILLDPRIPRSLQRLAGPQILVGSGDRDHYVREALPDRRDRLEQDVDALLDGVTAGESDDLAVAEAVLAPENLARVLRRRVDNDRRGDDGDVLHPSHGRRDGGSALRIGDEGAGDIPGDDPATLRAGDGRPGHQ